MKKLLLLLVLLFGVAAVARAEGTIIFCDSFNNQFEPQNVGDTFPGPGLSVILAQDQPFGVMSLGLSLYKRDGNEEAILDRVEFDVNPKWSAYGIRNLPMPGPGEYALGFTMPDGKTIAQATVTITGGAGEKPAEPQETLGGTLERAFNKYAPKKQEE